MAFKNHRTRFLRDGLVAVTLILALGMVQQAFASCGAVTCFVTIGSQQQVPQKGLLTVNAFYNYVPMRLPDGTTGVIPHVDQERRRMTLDEHKELSTITQTYTLDLNYGMTDRAGLQLTVPYLSRTHDHLGELGEANAGAGQLVQISDKGIGDLRLTAKYNVLPTLRSMVVMGAGVDFPTGDSRERSGNPNFADEAPLQLGRGNVGLIGLIYQTYEVIPHRLNQFAFVSYRHTFRNRDGYQFGDEYLLNVVANLVTVPWLVLTNQLNYRYLVHDNMNGALRQAQRPGDPGFPGDPITIDPTVKDRRVPNTGSTYLAYTPGFLLNLGATTQFYFYAQIPIARDFNNNLAQGVSYVVGLTRFFAP